MIFIRHTTNIMPLISYENPVTRRAQGLLRTTRFRVEELDGFLAKRGSANVKTRRSLPPITSRRGGYCAFGADCTQRSLRAWTPIRSGGSLPRGGQAVRRRRALSHGPGDGRAYSVHWRIVYLSDRRSAPLAFQSHEFRRAPVPPPLRERGLEMFGVIRHNRSGVEVRVTSHERTMVDLLDRPELTPELERNLAVPGSGGVLHLDQLVEYTRMLHNSTTAAKVGFFLERHRGWSERIISASCPARTAALSGSRVVGGAAWSGT